MRTLFYSDPHIGLNRKANMTVESNAAREKYALDRLRILLEEVSRGQNLGESVTVCGGDFFDKTSNPEEVILSALPIADLTDIVLSGNHDVHNREGRESSLTLLAEMFPGKVLLTDDSKLEGFSMELGQTLFCMAPHCLTQDAYMQMVDSLAKEADQYNGFRVLLLHCNWDMDPERLTESTLNLTKADAERLLSSFHHILIGHVHTPADYYEGRVKILGSTFPTAFDNLTDKRMLEYDCDTGAFTEHRVWSSERAFIGKASECPAPGMHYYDLTDDLDPGKAQKLVVDLFKSGAFGVRLQKSEDAEQEKVEFSSAQFSNLAQSIATDIRDKKPHLVPLWEEMTA